MRGGLTCYLHPESAAGDRCSACNRTICPVCVVEIAHRTVCRGCADRAAARRGRIRLAVVAVVLLASATSLWLLFLRSTGQSAEKPAADAGPPEEMLAEMGAMRVRLRADPCDNEAAWQLAGMQNALRDYAGTLALIDRTIAKCGATPALHQASLYALEKTGNWDRAVALTSELVAERPRVPDYWAWRGDALAGKGELEQAAFDYRQSLALQPNNAVVKFADLARTRGRPCEGVFAVTDFIDRVATTRGWVHDLRHDLYVEGDCAPRLGRGSGWIATDRTVRALVGTGSAKVAVSGEQAHVVLTRGFAERTGLEVAASPTITILLDGELTTASVAVVSLIEIDGLSASGFEVAVVDEIGRKLDGIVGLDFLWRFEVTWWARKIELRPLSIAL